MLNSVVNRHKIKQLTNAAMSIYIQTCVCLRNDWMSLAAGWTFSTL